MYIKNTIGTIDNTVLSDVKYDKCIINFKTFSPITNESPGLLIEIKRLNIPCDSGSYIILNEFNKLCGKLEDISPNERVHYFPFYHNTSIYLNENPIFSMNYKLVDYCYNVTLTSRNSSFLLQPKHDLECYFKIHLPYGNRIELNVYQNFYTKLMQQNTDDALQLLKELTSSFRNRTTDDASDSEYVDLMSMQYIENIDFCSGIAIGIKDSMTNDEWLQCIQNANTAKMFAFKSTGNSLLIHVSKIAYGDYIQTINDNHNNERASVYIEYNAVPIPEIVSQCAFGWIIVNQFCISTIELALPWKQAENHCKSLGGHLASIKSEREQKLIDTLLINR